MAATGYVGDNPLFLLGYVLRLARVVVLLALWRTILGGRGPVGGMTLDAVLTYTLIAEVFAEPLAARTELAWTLFTGNVATRFLWPIGVVGQFAAEAAGRWAVGLALFSLPLLLVAPSWVGLTALVLDRRGSLDPLWSLRRHDSASVDRLDPAVRRNRCARDGLVDADLSGQAHDVTMRYRGD